jgi:hypothetical protein
MAVVRTCALYPTPEFCSRRPVRFGLGSWWFTWVSFFCVVSKFYSAYRSSDTSKTRPIAVVRTCTLCRTLTECIVAGGLFDSGSGHSFVAHTFFPFLPINCLVYSDWNVGKARPIVVVYTCTPYRSILDCSRKPVRFRLGSYASNAGTFSLSSFLRKVSRFGLISSRWKTRPVVCWLNFFIFSSTQKLVDLAQY